MDDLQSTGTQAMFPEKELSIGSTALWPGKIAELFNLSALRFA
jgi:hypothetical protein